MKKATIPTMLVTTAQAARALQISERTIFALISKGVLESVKIAGCRRINLDVLKVVASVGAVERTGKVGRPRHKATTPAQRRESR